MMRRVLCLCGVAALCLIACRGGDGSSSRSSLVEDDPSSVWGSDGSDASASMVGMRSVPAAPSPSFILFSLPPLHFSPFSLPCIFASSHLQVLLNVASAITLDAKKFLPLCSTMFCSRSVNTTLTAIMSCTGPCAYLSRCSQPGRIGSAVLRPCGLVSFSHAP